MELEATPKRARACGGSSLVAGEPDRLSALPDCLLHTIMSFMKARQMVQTCVLSTRWRHLWRSVPCLDLDLGEFKEDEDNESSSADEAKEWEHFEDFAVNLMIRRNVALLDSFRLNANKDRVPSFARGRASTWVRRAMKYCAPDPGIHREGLSSDSWRLKRLYLCNIQLDDRFANHVSSACHSLEDLELKDCRCRLDGITSHSLKNLVLKNCICELSHITSSTLTSLVIGGGWNASVQLVIKAPAIAYLRLAVEIGKTFISITEMLSLDKASIDARYCRYSAWGSILRWGQFDLLCSVSNATCLELSNLQTLLLGEESTTFKEFKNLSNLVLNNCDLNDDFQTLVAFLENSPNLEKLTLRHCKFSNDSKKKKGKKASLSQCHSFDVRCSNLKLTEIIYNDDDVFPLVELLLRISGKLPKNYLKLRKVD